jgi:hypothetical protein
LRELILPGKANDDLCMLLAKLCPNLQVRVENSVAGTAIYFYAENT